MARVHALLPQGCSVINVLAPTPRFAQQPLAFISTDTLARGHAESVSVGPLHQKRPLGPAFYTDNIAPDYPGCSGPACLRTPCWGRCGAGGVGGAVALSHQAHSLQPASATTVSQNRTSRSQRASKEGSWRDWPRTGDSEAFPLASWGWQDLPPLCWVPIPEAPSPQGFQLCQGDNRTVH